MDCLCVIAAIDGGYAAASLHFQATTQADARSCNARAGNDENHVQAKKVD